MKYKSFISILLLTITFSLHSKESEKHDTFTGSINGYNYTFLKKDVENPYFFKKNKNFYEIFYFHDYKCGSCYMLQPKINLWREAFKKDNTRYIPVPISLNSNYGSPYIYLILRKLGYKTENIKSIQNDIFEKKVKINSKENIFDYLNKKIKLSKKDFNKIISSYEFNTKLKILNQIKENYNITETPLIIINHNNKRYKIKTNNNTPLSIILSLNIITNQN
tara:strand:+ start:116429 stop:117091 length:663 start_codon:yes stop_codon:yes gene_type:complete